MKKSWLSLGLFCALVWIILSCGKKETKTDPAPQVQKKQVIDVQNNISNGGELEVVFGNKIIKDDYLVAQFTARSEIFSIDNLQIYNYDVNSDVYPQFLISIDAKESDLNNWKNKSYSLSLCSLVLDEDAVPFRSEGQVMITIVTEDEIHGHFQGHLINIVNYEKMPIQGSFRAKIKYNS